ncbi:MAG: hypothetical protein KGL39_17705 [Patescibacteria group bacterium]|nr:hypothetical protein [Patescibacteria group bacterium]
MARTKPIPVRLPVDVIDRLDKAAQQFGNNRAGLIRFLIETWLTYWQRNGESALPPNWQRIIEAQDGRRATSDEIQAFGGVIYEDAEEQVRDASADMRRSGEAGRPKTPKAPPTQSSGPAKRTRRRPGGDQLRND